MNAETQRRSEYELKTPVGQARVRGWVHHQSMIAVLLTGIIFAAVAPTLRWVEFSSSMEDLNVATALEIRRTGNWLVPTLQGEARVAKPPLCAWITAAMISPDTMIAISSGDFDVRNRGFQKLAWQLRSIALLAACAMLMMTYHIGRMLAGPDVGLIALIVAGTSLLFLRFSRFAILDVQLAMWVTLANLLLLSAVIEGRWWLGCIGGGIALGLAMLTKGPVALLQSVLPIAAYLIWTGQASEDNNRSAKADPTGLPCVLGPIIGGIIVFLLVGLSWYCVLLLSRPGVMRDWWFELMRYKDPDTRRSPWYAYLSLLPYVAPWIGFFIAGLIAAFRRGQANDRLLLLLVLLPIIAMSFFPDRYERYLLPMLPAAAIITALAVVEHLDAIRWGRIDRMLNFAHWLTLAAIAVAFPIAASGLIRQITRIDGQPWFTPAIGWQSGLFAASVIAVSILLQRRSRWTLPTATLALMLGTQSLFIAGYAQSGPGRAEFRPLAERILDACPDAEVFNAHPRGKRPPPEIGVYLNRVLLWIADPSTLTPGSYPKVLLMLQDKGEGEPAPPPGWMFLDRHMSGNTGWWAFVLPAAPPAS